MRIFIAVAMLYFKLKFYRVTEARLEPELVSWDEKKEAPKVTPRTNNLTFRTAELTRQADSLCRSNAPNSRIFDELLPKLKEDGDVDRICVLLKRIKDLPEEWLADLLNFFLEQPQFDKLAGNETRRERNSWQFCCRHRIPTLCSWATYARSSSPSQPSNYCNIYPFCFKTVDSSRRRRRITNQRVPMSIRSWIGLR